jgi:5-methylcytosine-specific restriction enzyme A
MSKRREFSTSVKVEIIKRATRDGVTYCEWCKLPTRRWEIDHIVADGLCVDKSRPLTAKDGELLCKEVCHADKTTKHDVPAIAKAKRREATFVGAKHPAGTIKSPGFARPPAKDRTVTKVANGVSEMARRFSR